MSKDKKFDIIKTDDIEGVGWKDIVAIVIAQFQIMMPIIIGAILVMGLLLFIVMKVWIRNL